MLKRSPFFVCTFVLVLLTGCASKPPGYSGIRYPPATKTSVIFQEKDVPSQCRVFAHLIVNTPAGLTGAGVAQGITDYAKDKGADLILIGMTRRVPGKGTSEFAYFPYGPHQEYLFTKGWLGWKFGYANWEAGGGMIGFGYPNWSDTTVYDFSMKIQAVLLRCAPVQP